MVKTKRSGYSRRRGGGRNPPPNGNGGNGGDDPTEAVFRVDLKTGKMRVTDQKGDEIVEDPVTPAKIAKYGIEGSEFLGVIFYAKCNIKHGGCVIKIVNNREMLVW